MAGRRAETGTNVKISNNYNNKLRDERGAVSLCKAFSPIEFLKVFFLLCLFKRYNYYKRYRFLP